MPHIDDEEKAPYDHALNKLCYEVAGKPVGHVVYLTYVIALRWLMSSPEGTLPKFQRRLMALGGLNEAQHELRRLHLHDYEDAKIGENGEAQ